MEVIYRSLRGLAGVHRAKLAAADELEARLRRAIAVSRESEERLRAEVASLRAANEHRLRTGTSSSSSSSSSLMPHSPSHASPSSGWSERSAHSHAQRQRQQRAENGGALSSGSGDSALQQAQSMVATLAAQQERSDEIHRGLLDTIASQRRTIASLQAGGSGEGDDERGPTAAPKTVAPKPVPSAKSSAALARKKSIVGLRFSANPLVAKQLGRRRKSVMPSSSSG
tara:strand:+ start:166 stop:846 length:681 start_codon:yes stop_codon:yes gene_type:complete